MGSSISYHLSRRGAKTLVLERFKLNHENGSSHGRTRIIRTAYFEDPRYVRLAKRAFQLWSALEKESGKRLLEVTGGLMIGKPETSVVSGSLRSAREYSLPHSLLSAKEVAERFPAFSPSESESALYEPNAGVLFPERCLSSSGRSMKVAISTASPTWGMVSRPQGTTTARSLPPTVSIEG